MSAQTIIIAVLAMLTVGGLAFVFIDPLLTGERRGEKRQAKVAATVTKTRGGGTAVAMVDAQQRRKQVADTLKEIEARSIGKKATLELRLMQAGLDWSKQKYIVASVIGGLMLGVVVFILSGNLLLAPAALAIGGAGLPAWMLAFLRKRRIAKFINEFPNAMDVIVRGIKAGLPLGDCIKIIANEAAEPVRTEFRRIVESQALGLSNGEACERIVERVPVTEANFFSIVINIQAKSGGNLSEALGNLSRVLRERKKMKSKVSAMSMEAKASAAVVGSLPFVVTILVYLSSPRYIELLWLTTTGRIALGCCAVWMSLGVLMMKKMISFDI
jgi:tight adherence protein B